MNESSDNRHHTLLEMDQIQYNSRSSSPRSRRDLVTATSDAETVHKDNIPPKANPEFDEDDGDDDDDDDEVPYTPDGRPGVDDAFFPIEPKTKNDLPHPNDDTPNGMRPRRPSVTSFPNSNFPADYTPGIVTINGVPTQVPDVNVYQHKKTLAQGMMDLALLSANANQLRYILESYKRHPFFYVSLTMISMSIILQIAIGVGLILNSRYNVTNKREICKANRINNFTVIGIFIVTVVNVIISAFGVSEISPEISSQPLLQPPQSNANMQ